MCKTRIAFDGGLYETFYDEYALTAFGILLAEKWNARWRWTKLNDILVRNSHEWLYGIKDTKYQDKLLRY